MTTGPRAICAERDHPPRPEPPAPDERVVYWLDTARARLAEAGERRRRAEQDAAKEADR